MILTLDRRFRTTVEDGLVIFRIGDDDQIWLTPEEADIVADGIMQAARDARGVQ